MELICFAILMILIGFGIGAEVMKRYFYSKNVGNLRVDRSTGDDSPYLFLEITKGNTSKIQQDKIVLLKVMNENYIPHD